ncbi:uncharacterized protein LOC120539392 isoform X1 [Polypterus senegalus]|uniref:uncharacterized protein LOC120539392 isoform X1 n=1 Tax=Polypterus senegalus TaxID=55291 RepID=UPI0019627854|nr:uncharacterized protein LOC120539392 isoform X1 [Polypterus senegalus]
MKTFVLLAIFLSLALPSQAADSGFNVKDIVKGLNDLTGEKRELGLNVDDLVQGLNGLTDQKRELESENVEDEAQDVQEGEIDESEFQDESNQIEGQEDDQQQKREFDLEEDDEKLNEDDSLSQRELGEKAAELEKGNTDTNKKRWYGCYFGHRRLYCSRVLYCKIRPYRRCSYAGCYYRYYRLCLIRRKICVRRRYCRYYGYYRYYHCRRCYYSTYWKYV